MAGQTNFLKLLFGNCKSLLTNRLVASTSFVQNVGLKKDTQEKLENLKLPEKPKRPTTPFFRYLAEQRPLLLRQHPDWQVTQLAKQCSQNWNRLSKDEKEKYVNAYQAEIVSFTPKFLEYKESLTDAQKEALTEARKERRNSKKRRTLLKMRRDTNKPKRPKTSYLYFIQEKRLLPANQNKRPPELAAIYKEEWNAMTAETKQKYSDMQRADQDRYEKEMEAWEIKMVQEGREELVRKKSQFLVAAKPSHMEIPKKAAHKIAHKPSHEETSKHVDKPSRKETSKHIDKPSHKEPSKKKGEH